MQAPNIDTAARLNSLLDYLGDVAKDTHNFAIEQAPLVAQEIVAWHLWNNLAIVAMLFFFSMIVIGLDIWLIRRCIKRTTRPANGGRPECNFESPDDLPWQSIAVLFISIFLLPVIISGPGHIAAAIKAKVAPRLVILDYIKDVTK